MAYIYSTAQTTSSYGNINMKINIYRDDCTRTETSVSFKFGVCFTPADKYIYTQNSVAAWYNDEQRFATASSGDIKTSYGTTYHACYTDRKTSRSRTSEYLCYTYTNESISATTKEVSVKVGVGWANWAGTKKGTLTFKLTIPEYHGDVSAGTVTITDNGNNSFKINATPGTPGVNNTISDPSDLRWGYDKNYNGTYDINENIALSISGTATSRKIYAQATTFAEFGQDAIAYAEKDIKQYFNPNDPGKPALSYSKRRLTIKENWTYTWTAATTPNSTTSPIKGYRIRLYKNGNAIKGLVVSSGNTITIGSNPETFLDRESTSTTIEFNPAAIGFKPKDTVQLGISAYTKWGDGSIHFNRNGLDANILSAVSTVQNAGIMHINADGAWREGQVWVNVDGTWVEADSVHINDSSNWRESQ